MQINKREVIYAFIDSQNLNLGVRSMGWILDFKRFLKYLQDKYKVTKAFLFMGYVEKYREMYARLEGFGYELVFKPTVPSEEGGIKGNVDSELVLWASNIEYDKYDKAIIISGDGDFYCLIRLLEEKRKLYKVFIPNQKRFSQLLLPFRQKLLFMNDLKKKLELKK